ncbi:MAG: cysteine synthase A [Candidatus Omnitrophica bacterium]|nr:cysteine synthase A [Candidatus Omnitrophota bacterium]
MGKIYDDITGTIGNTPLVRINNMTKGLDVTLLAKLESFNPLSSSKDRVGFAMIAAAEKEGKINKETVIIEPTSGNTGIALAFVCAAKGYKLILTMPENMSIERKKLFTAFGAEVVLTDKAQGMGGAVKKAQKLSADMPNSLILGQFSNPVNPQIHRETTAREILSDTDGKLDIFIAGVGTGGTITGVAQKLKEFNPKIKIIAVEPDGSPVLSGGLPGEHAIQGIGAGFVPEVLQRELIDEILRVKDEDAKKTTRELAKFEGILAGISSGAVMWASIKAASKEENKGKIIVAFLPDTGERYLSSDLFDI